MLSFVTSARVCETPLTHAGRYMFFSALQGMRYHSLTVSEKGRHDQTVGGQTAIDGSFLKADLRLRNSAAFFRKLVLHTDVGFAEAYMAGDFETTDLYALLKVLLDNRNHVNDYVSWTGSLLKWTDYAYHYFVRAPSTQSKAKQNIAEHYDLTGLFHHFLDPTMSYSSAMFASPDQSLHEAQLNKIASTVEALRLQPGHEVLEIGCGWGGVALALASRGFKVHGLTLSEEQLAYCNQLAATHKLAHLMTFELCDYRAHKTVNQYDRIVSIEMLEAVGHAYLGAFFQSCDRLLKPDGLVFVQVITMSDSRYESYRVRPDFINTYIFPGGCCPSLTALIDAATYSSQLQIEQLSNIGPDYATTLDCWARKFGEAWPVISKGGKYNDVFFRKWMYYFRYCQVAFATRTIATLRILWTRSCNSTI